MHLKNRHTHVHIRETHNHSVTVLQIGDTLKSLTDTCSHPVLCRGDLEEGLVGLSNTNPALLTESDEQLNLGYIWFLVSHNFPSPFLPQAHLYGKYVTLFQRALNILKQSQCCSHSLKVVDRGLYYKAQCKMNLKKPKTFYLSTNSCN